MNEDVKKNMRTQGKYSDKVNFKNRDKRQKDSPTDKEPPGKKSHRNKKNSNVPSDQDSSLTDTSANDSSVKYECEENSKYKFVQLEEKKPIEVKTSGLHKISDTDNGISTIFYEPEFIDYDEGNELYDELMSKTNWNERNIVIHGQEYPQPRLVAWYGPFPYSYSGVTLEPAEMPEIVLRVKDRVEGYLEKEQLRVTLNSVLLNYYRDGHDSVSWHSDDELTMGICPTIASVSLGETRKFEMRRKRESCDAEISADDEQLYLNLTHGSLLIMNGAMQDDWQHRVPKEYHDKDGRINLTFRTVYSLDKSPSGMSSKGYKSKIIGSNFSEKSSSAKICFKDDDFPPLGSPISPSEKIPPTGKSFKPDYLQMNEDTDLSMESIDTVIKKEQMDGSVAPVSVSSLCVSDLIDEIHIKHENISVNDSFASDSDMMNTDDSMENNTICGVSSHVSPVDSKIQSSKNKYENRMYADKIVETNLNVEAEEFFPNSPVPADHLHQQNIYDNCDLWELITFDAEDMDNDSFLKYSDVLKAKVFRQLNEFYRFQKEEIMFIIELIEKSTCEFTQKLARKRLCNIVKRFFEYNSSKYSRNSLFYGSYLQGECHNSQKEFNNPNQRKKHSYEGSRNRGENHSRSEVFSERYRNTPTQSEEFASQGEEYSVRESINSFGAEGHSNRDGECSKENKNFNKSEGYSSRDDYPRGVKNSVRGLNRDDYSSKGSKYSGRGQKFSNRGSGYSGRNDEYSSRDEARFSRGYRHNFNRRGHSSQGPRLSKRGESNSNRGQGRHDREGDANKEADLDPIF